MWIYLIEKKRCTVTVLRNLKYYSNSKGWLNDKMLKSKLSKHVTTENTNIKREKL
jgi:hypothetical protein